VSPVPLRASGSTGREKSAELHDGRPFRGCYAIRYSDQFAKVQVDNLGAAISVLHTKHPDWSYEREVRFVKFGDREHPELGGTVSFSKRSLTALMLGCRVPPAVWRAVEILLDHFDYAHTKLLRGSLKRGASTSLCSQSPPLRSEVTPRRPRRGF
jgi:hypothetical protein